MRTTNDGHARTHSRMHARKQDTHKTLRAPSADGLPVVKENSHELRV